MMIANEARELSRNDAGVKKMLENVMSDIRMYATSGLYTCKIQLYLGDSLIIYRAVDKKLKELGYKTELNLEKNYLKID